MNFGRWHGQTAGVRVPAPGSVVSGERTWATVENSGAVSVGAGLAVSFYLGAPGSPGRLLGTVRTDERLVPGASTTVELDFDPTSDEQGVELDFFVRVDDVGDGTGEHNECDEDDNTSAGTFECGVIE